MQKYDRYVQANSLADHETANPELKANHNMIDAATALMWLEKLTPKNALAAILRARLVIALGVCKKFCADAFATNAAPPAAAPFAAEDSPACQAKPPTAQLVLDLARLAVGAPGAVTAAAAPTAAPQLATNALPPLNPPHHVSIASEASPAAQFPQSSQQFNVLAQRHEERLPQPLAVVPSPLQSAEVEMDNSEPVNSADDSEDDAEPLGDRLESAGPIGRLPPQMDFMAALAAEKDGYESDEHEELTPKALRNGRPSSALALELDSL